MVCMNVLSIEEVTRSFGSLTAVGDLSLSLGRDEIMGFLGTNGAGKTTIKMLTGLLRPTVGIVKQAWGINKLIYSYRSL